MSDKSEPTLKIISIPPLPTSFVRRNRDSFDLDKYISDRKANRPADAGIPAADWFDHLFKIADILKQYQIDAQLFAAALDIDEEAIDQACIQLLEKLSETRKAVGRGEYAPTRRALVASERLINHLAVYLIEALCIEEEPMPEALVVLSRELLGGTNTELIQEHQPENLAPREMAAQVLAQMPEIGVRQLAKTIGVAPSTISRWRKQEDFQREIQFWKMIFSEEEGSPSKSVRDSARGKGVADDS